MTTFKAATIPIKKTTGRFTTPPPLVDGKIGMKNPTDKREDG